MSNCFKSECSLWYLLAIWMLLGDRFHVIPTGRGSRGSSIRH